MRSGYVRGGLLLLTLLPGQPGLSAAEIRAIEERARVMSFVRRFAEFRGSGIQPQASYTPEAVDTELGEVLEHPRPDEDK